MRLVGVIACVVACSAPPQRPVARDRADLVLFNGRGATSAVAIRSARIIAVGPEATRMDAARRIDLQGHLMIPGIHDAHVHEPVLFDAREVAGSEQDDDSAATLGHIERAVTEVPPGTWLHAVLGNRSIDMGGLPRDALDRVAPGHPLWIDNSTGHVVVMNSLAEQQLGVPHNPARPGWHYEYERYRAMKRRAEDATDADIAAAVDAFEAQEIAWGVTSVTAFPLDVDADRLAAVLRASHRHLRWHVVRTPLDGIIKPRPPSSTDRVVVEGTKYFIDGMPTERGAALIDPYDDAPTSGSLDFSLEEIGTMLEASRDTGDTLHLHAVGDRAIATVLDAAERVPGAHLVIEHAHLITSDDIDRAKRLGVAIVATPVHASQAVSRIRLGFARAERAVPLAQLVETGIPLSLGSDGPENPFAVLAQAVGQLTLEQALRAATDESIRVGAPADLAVLDIDLFHAKTFDAHSVLTIVGGEIVYEASPASGPSSARTE